MFCHYVSVLASAITTTPNTFLSLLPTAAISAISWMLRKKFMNTDDVSNTDTDPKAYLETGSTSQNTTARGDEDNTNNSEENGDQNDNTQTAGIATGDTETTSHEERDTIYMDNDNEQIPLISEV